MFLRLRGVSLNAHSKTMKDTTYLEGSEFDSVFLCVSACPCG